MSRKMIYPFSPISLEFHLFAVAHRGLCLEKWKACVWRLNDLLMLVITVTSDSTVWQNDPRNEHGEHDDLLILTRPFLSRASLRTYADAIHQTKGGGIK